MGKTIKVTGTSVLRNRWEAYRKAKEVSIQELRRQIVETIVLELAINIPVWSGRTLSSIRVNSDGSFAPLQGSEFSASDKKKFDHGAQKGGNSFLHEAMREEALAVALAEPDKALNIPINRPVYVTINSEAWGLVENAQAPTPELAKNKAVVSEIALATARAKFPFLR